MEMKEKLKNNEQLKDSRELDFILQALDKR